MTIEAMETLCHTRSSHDFQQKPCDVLVDLLDKAELQANIIP